MIPGPTISMKSGQKCTLLLKNSLSTTSPVATCHYHSNELHCPDTTNVHTHGLHIGSDVDDVTLAILPGDSHTYAYIVLESHLMATRTGQYSAMIREG